MAPSRGFHRGIYYGFLFLYFIPFMDSFRGNYFLLIAAIIQGPFARILLR